MTVPSRKPYIAGNWKMNLDRAAVAAFAEAVAAPGFAGDADVRVGLFAPFVYLESLAQALADAPMPLIPGWHQRRFADGRVLLSVYHGTAETMVEALARSESGAVDAFYLDGFAPDRNPAMWSPALFEQLTRCAGTGSTVATFTAAGAVRRGLAAANPPKK